MKNYLIQIEKDNKKIFSGHIKLQGSNPEGEKLSFTNYYMEKNGKPFFGICGEFHYSRYDADFWEDEIIKMKMNGVNIISTYIFWNFHEEIQGEWDWSGNKNLKKFIELCGKHNLYVIIRIGPFDHGEVRNGGIPDWIFGRPFDIRSNDEGYLKYTKALYLEISKQVDGLLYKEGGPVIGTQLENEHNHSAATWAQTVGVSDNWLISGKDGEDHLRKLKEIALDVGIDTPIYTCTGWGGASTPVEEMLPLWGGYAFWPWIYYENGDDVPSEHPATPEYIFRDKHNNGIPKSYNFEPKYTPEDYPYACCEMGGGMLQFYKYRFEFPYISVPAMTGIKTAEGCNFIGYYMFHGGSNPKGKTIPFMNDMATPKISYDFNAAIGEYGQVRESYKRIKLQHYFFSTFEEDFCITKTSLPQNAWDMDPYDTESLRYAVRSRNGSGYLFINNYQDHVENHDLDDFSISLDLENEQINIPESGDLHIGKDSFCMLPFNFDFGEVRLKYSTTQLITKIESEGKSYYFFFVPRGMMGEYCFVSENIKDMKVDSISVEIQQDLTTLQVDNSSTSLIEIRDRKGNETVICTIADEISLDFWKSDIWGRERVVISNANLLVSDDQIKVEATGVHDVEMSFFPDLENTPSVSGAKFINREEGNLFTIYSFELSHEEICFDMKKISDSKSVLKFSEKTFSGAKEILLQINYTGDIGYAFIDGELINDNFCNDTTWDIGLMSFKEKLIDKGMYIYISPLLEGASVDSKSTMAGWGQKSDKEIAEIQSIEAVPVYEMILKKELEKGA